MSWHFGGAVPADQDYRDQATLNQLLAVDHGGVLVLGISRMGKTSLLYRLGEKLGKKPKDCVIQVSSPERALSRIEKADGLILLDEAQHLREWKGQELRRLRTLLEEPPFVMAAHPSLFRGSMDAELRALVDDLRRKKLHPLDGQAAKDMIRRARSATPETCDSTVVAAIHRATGGFPSLIASLCMYLTEEGQLPLRAPGEADLRNFVRSDIGGDVFRNIYDSLPPQMQEVLDDHRSGRPADLGLLREPFLVSVSEAAADFSATLFPRVWGPEGSWVSRKLHAESGAHPEPSACEVSTEPLMWDFFLAYARTDYERVKSLYTMLSTNHRVFFDKHSVSPGDDWALTIQRALKSTRFTIVLISTNSEAAHYQREEISTAIQLARKDAKRRVIPVYLDGPPSGIHAAPYGLGPIHGLDAQELGMEGIAAALRKAAASTLHPDA